MSSGGGERGHVGPAVAHLADLAGVGDGGVPRDLRAGEEQADDGEDAADAAALAGDDVLDVLAELGRDVLRGLNDDRKHNLFFRVRVTVFFEA